MGAWLPTAPKRAVGSLKFRCKKENIEVVAQGETYVISLMAKADVETAHWILEGIQFQNLEDAIAWIKARSNMTGISPSHQCGTTPHKTLI